MAHDGSLQFEMLRGDVQVSSIQCDLRGDSSFDFAAHGEATGPYPGTFRANGHVRIGRQQDPAYRLFVPFVLALATRIVRRKPTAADLFPPLVVPPRHLAILYQLNATFSIATTWATIAGGTHYNDGDGWGALIAIPDRKYIDAWASALPVDYHADVNEFDRNPDYPKDRPGAFTTTGTGLCFVHDTHTQAGSVSFFQHAMVL